MSLIKLNKVYKKYGTGSGSVAALSNISLEIEKGSMVAIIGKSGCGKSTLINILGGLTAPTQGQYLYDGEIVEYISPNLLSKFRRNNIGFIVQNFALINNKTARENIELPILNLKISIKNEKVKNIAQKLDIANKLDRYPFELSGGECQRVAIARALVNEPKVILADEPTGSLDTQNEEIIISILREIADNGTTVVVVTHDMNVANRCDKIISLKDGFLET